MASLTRIFSRPSAKQAAQEFDLGIAAARGINEDAVLEQEAILQGTEATEKAAIFNANILRRNSRLAVDNARIDAARVRRRGRRLQGSQRVAVAASGFTTAGFEDLIGDSAAEDEMDALLITRNGRIQAESLLTQSRLQLQQAAGSAEASAISLRSVGRRGEREVDAAILSGRNRARSVRRTRQNEFTGSVVGAGFEVAAAAAGGGPFGRLNKVLF